MLLLVLCSKGVPRQQLGAAGRLWDGWAALEALLQITCRKGAGDIRQGSAQAQSVLIPSNCNKQA